MGESKPRSCTRFSACSRIDTVLGASVGEPAKDIVEMEKASDEAAEAAEYPAPV